IAPNAVAASVVAPSAVEASLPATSTITAAPETGVADTGAVGQESPAQQREQAKTRLEELIREYRLNVIAIGNGNAWRETEELVSELIAERLPDLEYIIVNEAGASVYSSSAVGRDEFPNFDALLRGTISIGRRLQDPLSELVKIDPQSIGVGLYQ